jgi:hypothetical protein
MSNPGPNQQQQQQHNALPLKSGVIWWYDRLRSRVSSFFKDSNDVSSAQLTNQSTQPVNKVTKPILQPKAEHGLVGLSNPPQQPAKTSPVSSSSTWKYQQQQQQQQQPQWQSQFQQGLGSLSMHQPQGAVPTHSVSPTHNPGQAGWVNVVPIPHTNAVPAVQQHLQQQPPGLLWRGRQLHSEQVLSKKTVRGGEGVATVGLE